jgi:transcriptional regulator with XRE-family HTH domain
MSVESLVEQVPVDVGRRVRDARVARGWTLDQVAERSGVSRRMIVNVEAGTSNASIATLLRLATALRVSLAELVAGGCAVLVASADTPDMLELWEWRMEPGESYESEAHRPGTRELLHVISGRLTLVVGDDLHDLHVGDAASFAADHPHRYANGGRRPLRFTMTVLEPRARVRP